MPVNIKCEEFRPEFFKKLDPIDTFSVFIVLFLNKTGQKSKRIVHSTGQIELVNGKVPIRATG